MHFDAQAEATRFLALLDPSGSNKRLEDAMRSRFCDPNRSRDVGQPGALAMELRHRANDGDGPLNALNSQTFLLFHYMKLAFLVQ